MTRGPNDPDRRERIVAAATELMGRDGLHTLTHRRIAAAAGVPLGSTTYYFRDLGELVAAAAQRAAAQSHERIRERIEDLDAGADAEAVCRAMAALTVDYVTTHRARTVLDYELYVAGLRSHPVGPEWIGRLRAALRARFDPLTADALTAAVDGLTLQSLLARRTPTVDEVTALLLRVVR